ncbi:MAG: NAD-dependent protein deacylase [Candidatus Limivicinus sp.]|jgi:NAD-dependent deacetylase
MKEEIRKLRSFLKASDYTVFFTGAGVSTDSGLADFRSSGRGLYNKPNPYGVPTEKILSLDFYVEHPEEFFEFYRSKLLKLEARPNSVHYAIAELQRRGLVQGLITQNADELHRRAGSQNVISIHGSVYNNRCEKCGRLFTAEKVAHAEGVPTCGCGGIIRPGIVLFDQIPDMGEIMKAVKELNRAELLVVAGSSLKVSSAWKLLKNFRGRMVILNLEPTPFDNRAELVINSELSEIFDALMFAGKGELC